MAAGLLGNKLKFMIKTILIVGTGSIGQKHAKNANSLGVEKIILVDINPERVRKFAKEINTELVYQDYKKAIEENPDIEAAIISTPSSLHIEPAEFLAEHKINILVEKPLSNNLGGVDNLIKIVKKNKKVAMMGQTYRFHEGFLKLKELLDKNTIGKIYHINYFGGQYLPNWHPNRDYRKDYTAQKRLGGGVFLTSASHGFDIIQWLFGDIIDITGWKVKLSNLEIDVKDSFFCLLKTKKGVIIQYQSDFLQRVHRHQMIIFGEKGYIEADFIKKEIKIWTVDNPEVEILNYQFNHSQCYIDELKHFFNLIEQNRIEHNLDLSVGKRILELILSPSVASINYV